MLIFMIFPPQLSVCQTLRICAMETLIKAVPTPSRQPVDIQLVIKYAGLS